MIVKALCRVGCGGVAGAAGEDHDFIGRDSFVATHNPQPADDPVVAVDQ
jgi:hypothetical protein